MQKFAAAIMLAVGAVASAQKPYIGGEIHSKETFKYGRFSATVRNSKAKGTGSSFYLYSLHNDENNHYYANNRSIWDEWIGIHYFPGDDYPFRTQVHKDMKNSWQPLYKVEDHGSFHLYEIEWTPQYMTFSIDGETVRYLDQAAVSGLHEEQNLMMSIFSKDNTKSLGQLENENLPTYTEFGYVEVHDYDINTKEFKLRYRDDLSTFDEQRWATSQDQSWGGMSSIFQPDNSYIERGMLKLKLDRQPVDDSDDDSDEESDHSGEESHEDSGEDSNDASGDDSHEDSGDESSDESDSEPDFHVLPPPKSETLDMAIEKATRVLVTMARTGLEQFSETMGQYLMHQ